MAGTLREGVTYQDYNNFVLFTWLLKRVPAKSDSTVIFEVRLQPAVQCAHW